MHFNDLVNDPEIDIVDEFKAWASANDYGIPRGAAALDYIDEKKGKALDRDGDGEVESEEDEYKGVKDKAIKKAMVGKKVNESEIVDLPMTPAGYSRGETYNTEKYGKIKIIDQLDGDDIPAANGRFRVEKMNEASHKLPKDIPL